MSKVVVDTIEDRSAAETVDAADLVHGSIKCWGNIDGTGTPSYDDSYNCSSLTDNGTGKYALHLTNAMSDANYASVYGGHYPDGGMNGMVSSGDTVSASVLSTAWSDRANALTDETYYTAAILGVLA